MTLEELVRISEASRLRLTESHAHLRRALDIPSRIRGSLITQPVKWVGGSIVAGLAASSLFRGKKNPPKVRKLKRQRGFLLGMLSLAVAMGRPLAKAYASKLLKDYLAARFAAAPRSRVAGLRKSPR